MKQLFFTILFLFAVANFAQAQTCTSVATDNFNRANGALDTGNWTSGGDVGNTGSMQIDTNQIRASGNPPAGNINQSAASYWTGAGSFTNNQCSTTAISVLNNTGTNDAVGVTCRHSGVDSTRTYYYFGVATNGGGSTWVARFGKVVNGTHTQFNSANVTISVGQTVGIKCNSTTITAMINGSDLTGSFTTTDSAISTGAPGVFNMNNGIGFGVGDDWVGSSFSAGGGSTARRRGQVY